MKDILLTIVMQYSLINQVQSFKIKNGFVNESVMPIQCVKILQDYRVTL